MNSAVLRSPNLRSGDDPVVVRFYHIPRPLAFANGGLARAAEMTRQAGRDDDSVLLHITPDELEFLRSKWGTPTKNPKTGLPEYGFVSKAWKKIKKVVKAVAPYAGIIAAVFMPALAPMIGGALGASGAAAAAVGNAVISGAAGAVTGGGKGALAGAVTGGLGSYAGKIGSSIAPGMSSGTQNVIGHALASGAGSSVSGGDFAQGAIRGGLTAALTPTIQSGLRGGRDALAGTAAGQKMGVTPSPTMADLEMQDVTAQRMGFDANGQLMTPEAQAAAQSATASMAMPQVEPTAPTNAAPQVAAAGAPAAQPAQQGLGDLATKYLPVATLAASAMQKKQQQAQPQLPPEVRTPLQDLPFDRQSQLPTMDDWYTYGMRPEESFYSANAIPSFKPNDEEDPNAPQVAARGGRIHYSRGALAAAGSFVRGRGTGRSDSIDAKLSDGEYVLTAEDVALIGDGSSDAGARRLDQWRRELRKHKGKALAKGEISPNAKSPMAYLSATTKRGDHMRA
jgi:hypothetical protein